MKPITVRKYKLILEKLNSGLSWKQITIDCGVSNSSITSAKKWDSAGRKILTTKKSTTILMKKKSVVKKCSEIPIDVHGHRVSEPALNVLPFITEKPITNYIWLRNLAQQMRIPKCHQKSKKQLKMLVKSIIDLI